MANFLIYQDVNQFYTDQITEPLEEGDELNYDNSIVYQMIKQILSRRLIVTYAESESAFDESEPVVTIDYDEGPF